MGQAKITLLGHRYLVQILSESIKQSINELINQSMNLDLCLQFHRTQKYAVFVESSNYVKFLNCTHVVKVRVQVLLN